MFSINSDVLTNQRLQDHRRDKQFFPRIYTLSQVKLTSRPFSRPCQKWPRKAYQFLTTIHHPQKASRSPARQAVLPEELHLRAPTLQELIQDPYLVLWPSFKTIQYIRLLSRPSVQSPSFKTIHRQGHRAAQPTALPISPLQRPDLTAARDLEGASPGP